MLFSSDKMWFTADQHFFHKNMYKEDFFNSGFKRPWRTEAEGRKNIIERHNSLVKKDDWVIHGGDFAMIGNSMHCLLYTSPSPRDRTRSRMPSSA